MPWENLSESSQPRTRERNFGVSQSRRANPTIRTPGDAALEEQGEESGDELATRQIAAGAENDEAEGPRFAGQPETGHQRIILHSVKWYIIDVMETRRASDPGMVSPWPGALVYHMERTTSTMDDARELARAGCPEGTVAVSDYQEKGRGRVPGRTWVSAPRESLLATLVLKIPGLGYDLEELPLRAGVAVALGIEDAAGIAVGIKWPNDVVAGAGSSAAGRKLAGTLCETHGDAALVGFGVNLLQTSFPGEIGRTACSLVQACGRILPAGTLLAAILHRLRSSAQGTAWQQELRARLHRRGEEVRVDLIGSGQTVQGTVLDIDQRGRLVLGLSDGSRRAVAQGELLTSP